jgi:hypothetical protein
MLTSTHIVSVETKKYDFTMHAFVKDPQIEGEMNSGYTLYYTDKENKDNNFIGECLDADHVYRELTHRGIDNLLIDFIINFC